MRTWDHETDLLAVGSGAAGMTAALVAGLEGLDSLTTPRRARRPAYFTGEH